MTTHIPPITEDDIAQFLTNTPGFFERHAEVLASVQITSPHGARAVSLQERQAEMLREKIKGLEQKIIEMIRNGQENVAIADRLHRWTQALMLTVATAELPAVLLKELRHQFLIPQAAVRVWSTAERPLRDGLADLACTSDVSDDIKSFANSLTHPYCGINSNFEAAKWLDEAHTITSLTMIPLRHDDACFGLLVLGSPDPTRYTAEMGVEFLEQLGDITGAALARLRT